MRVARFLVVPVLLVAAVAALVLTVARPAGMPVSLMITGGTVVTMDAQDRVIRSGAVVINGTRIVAVGPADDLAARYSPAERIDASAQVVLPGLINGHTHAPMVLFRGLADDRALADWLHQDIFPAEARMVSPEFVRAGTRLAAVEMIESGTTTFADMYYFEDDIASAVHQAGLRAVLGETIVDFPSPDAGTPQEGLTRAEAFIRRWRDDPLITPAVAPHAPYTVSAGPLKAARTLANRYDVPLLIHLAETRDEVTTIEQAHHQSPAQYLDALGVWNGTSVAAHGVWLSPDDMALLARRGVGVVHNPESNMKLASGIAPVTAWLRAGMRVGLGTDGAASSNDLDMFEAMRFAALLQKVATMDPQALPAMRTLEVATRRGAEALGLGAVTGSLEVGKQADVITVAMNGARQTPVFSPVSHLVYVNHGDDVRNTIVAGRVLMRDRRVLTLDAAEVMREARALADRVRQVVNVTAPGSAKERP